jgi:alpha-beta hydrolase superfamily lysophospholipase
MTESSFKGVGDLNIATRSWHPEAGTARGIVVIVPGFNSHSGYYEWVAEQLTADGLAVYSIDLRGRGKSDGERFYVQNFEDYVSDVASFVSIIKANEPGLPMFMLGHSAGGVVACNYTLDNQEKLAGLICESFAYQVPAPDFAIAVLKGLSHIAPHAHVLKLHNKDFSRDPKAVEFMNNDPLIENEAQPTQTIAAMVHADDRLKRDFEQFTLPLLILHGTNDKATKPSGSEYFYNTASSTDKTLKLYEGHYHDMLNDLDKEVVMADIKNWIDAHISKA